MDRISQTDAHTIDTPIGSLEFSASVRHGDLHKSQITSCTVEPNLPEGMSVDGCIAALFECYTEIPCQNLVFHCSWKNLKEKGYGCTGEALDAWEWERNKKLVIIGTEDNEWLSQRISFIEFASTAESYPVVMEDNCIKIRISNVPAGEKLSLHYIISWNSLPEPTESSCWFAVDIPHEQVLSACS